MEEVDADMVEGARWAKDDSDVVWCDSACGLRCLLQDGKRKVEVGAAQAGPVVGVIEELGRNIESLSLTGCGLTDEQLLRLGALLAQTQIQGVGVSNNCGVSLQAWSKFWEQMPATVSKWDFGDNELPDEVLPDLARVLLRGEVQDLYLDGNRFTDISPLLPLVSESCGLSELDLGDNNITDAQLKGLAETLPGSMVAVLVLGTNPITDAGAVPLMLSLPRTKVNTLFLDSTRVGDATLDALVSVLEDVQLEELHIDSTQVKDAGVLRLCKRLPSSRIGFLYADENDLAEETCKAIEAALPDDDVE